MRVMRMMRRRGKKRRTGPTGEMTAAFPTLFGWRLSVRVSTVTSRCLPTAHPIFHRSTRTQRTEVDKRFIPLQSTKTDRHRYLTGMYEYLSGWAKGPLIQCGGFLEHHKKIIKKLYGEGIYTSSDAQFLFCSIILTIDPFTSSKNRYKI